MLTLTQLIGFGSGSGGGTDATPDAINFTDVSDTGITASGATNDVLFTGIDTTITIRVTLSAAMGSGRTMAVYRNLAFVGSAASGTTLDVTVTNGQTLTYAFTNTLEATVWSGTATVTNLSDLSTTLDTFLYYLEATGGGGSAVVTF
jgi:hypothetical protein